MKIEEKTIAKEISIVKAEAMERLRADGEAARKSLQFGINSKSPRLFTRGKILLDHT